MSEYKNPQSIKKYAVDNLGDWLSYGIDPEESVVFVQSHIPQHLELFIILSTLTPLGWLYRCPTFKEQISQLKDKDINTYSFLGYPILQASDIIMYDADFVPVGEDQLPHLELCREIIRRFHFIYGKDIFKEPKALLTKIPRLMGLDGRKMSKSYDNYIALCEDSKTLQEKVLSMFTDPARKRRNDPGHPDICIVFSYYSVFKADKKEAVRDWCIKAKKGCRECKSELAKILEDFIAPHREKKRGFLKRKNYMSDVLFEGDKKAGKVSEKALSKVRNILGI